VGTTTDSYELRFAHPVRTSRQSYALFGRGGSPGLVLSVLSAAVADLRVGPDSVARLRLDVVATGGARSVEHDTTHAFRVAGGRESWVTIADETPLAPGAWSFGLALRASDSTGQYFRAVPLDVPAAGGGLALSDIVAAQESGGHRWAARDGALSLNATGTYRLGQPVLLYYEVSAGGSSAIRTRIELSDGHRTTTAAFSEPGQAGVAAFRRSLATTGLRTGTIAITVTITDGLGGSATRRLDVRLVK
jgi:hypothetical protein